MKILFLFLTILSLLNAFLVRISKFPCENPIAVSLSFKWEHLLLHLDELKQACESFRQNHTNMEYVCAVLDLGNLIYQDFLLNTVDIKPTKNAIFVFDSVTNIFWDTIKVFPCAVILQKMQLRAFATNKKDLVKHYYIRSVEFSTKDNEWAKKHEPLRASVPHSVWGDAKIAEKELKDAHSFIRDLKHCPERHEEIISELFNVPKGDFDEIIAFATQQVIANANFLVRNLEILKNLKSTSLLEYQNRYRIATKVTLSLANVKTIFHDLKFIKDNSDKAIGEASALALREAMKKPSRDGLEADKVRIKRAGLERAEARKATTTSLISNLMATWCNYGLPLPDEFQVFLDGYEEFSREWLYVKFRLMSLASMCTATRIFDNLPEKHSAFVQAQDPLAFVLMSKTILALLPLSTKFCQQSFPYIIFDNAADEQMRQSGLLSGFMEEKLLLYLNVTKTQPNISMGKLTTTFFTQALPNAFASGVKTLDLSLFKEISCMDYLLNINVKTSKKAKPVKKKAGKNANAVLQFAVDKPNSVSSETFSIGVSSDSQGEQVFKLSRESSSTSQEDPILDNKAILSDTNTEPSTKSYHEEPSEPVESQSQPDVAENVLVPRPKKVLFSEDLFKPQVFEIEYDQEEADKWTQIYEAELEKYAEIQSLPEFNSENISPSGTKFSVISAPVEINKQTCFVVNWSTNDFISLFPKASQVYYDNIAKSTAVLANHDKSVHFRWVFDPTIVIKSGTFCFLCKVFGLLDGRKELTFLNFQKTFLELTHGDTSECGSKNRTVFRFRHSFLLDGQLCIPPIGGVHPEHLSSRFNHAQVRKFFQKGGAHPYFFELIETED